MKKNILIILSLIFFSSVIFADVVDLYHLDTQNKEVVYQYIEGWSPIKREIDSNFPLTIDFYPIPTRGFIGTLDTNLYLKAEIICPENINNLFIKSIRINDSKKELFDLIINNKFEISSNSDENRLYTEKGNIYKINDKEIYYTIVDLDFKISGRKVKGKNNKKIYVTVDYNLNEKNYTYCIEYICEPHNFSINDFITLFVIP